MNSKTEWRQKILEKRRELPKEFISESSHRIINRLFSLEEFICAEHIGLYASFRGEVETEEIFLRSNSQRKEVYYPAVDAKHQILKFYRIRKCAELKPGFADILEPVSRTNPLKDIHYLNLIVVPGVVFDKQGHRIGYGQGFYDRLLTNYQGKRIALAYEFQVVEKIPALLEDQKVDFIVTEERVIKVR